MTETAEFIIIADMFAYLLDLDFMPSKLTRLNFQKA